MVICSFHEENLERKRKKKERKRKEKKGKKNQRKKKKRGRERGASMVDYGKIGVGQMKAKGHALLALKSKLQW